MAEHRGRRLGALSRHLSAECRSNVAADDGTEAPEPELLDDGQVQKFLADGFLVLPLDEDPEMHAAIHKAGQAYWENSGKAGGAGLGNNIFPAIPELGDVMASPKIDGALRSLLGDHYQMNAHRHMHNSSSQGMQSFHKDSQRNKPPNHLPRSLFVFYYAGGCSDEMGPTEIVPMSQFLGADDQDWSGVNETPSNLGPTIGSTRLTSPANRPVAVISHHAMIHRGCARLSDELDDESAPWRPMFKFIFSRGSSGSPKWRRSPETLRPWAEVTDEPALVPAIESAWDWLADAPAEAAGLPPLPEHDVGVLFQTLTAEAIKGDEAARTGSAYTLGRHAACGDQAALAALLAALSAPDSNESARRVAAPGLQAAGDAAVGGLCEVLRASDNYRVLMYAADALGEACRTPTTQVVDVLIDTLARLETMAESSERLAAWASEDSTRNQWDFAEDTAMTSCRSALKNVAGRAVSNPELRPIWSRLCEHYLGLFAAGDVAAAITGLVTLAGAPWAAEETGLVEAICDAAGRPGPQGLVHEALGGLQILASAAPAGGHARVVESGILQRLTRARYADPRDDPRQNGQLAKMAGRRGQVDEVGRAKPAGAAAVSAAPPAADARLRLFDEAPPPPPIAEFLDTPFTLTQAQIEEYKERGHVKLEQVISGEPLRYYRELIGLAVADVFEGADRSNLSVYQESFLQAFNLWPRYPAIKTFVHSFRFADIARQLMEVDGVRLWFDQALFKEAGSRHTDYHQDAGLWPVHPPEKTTTIWMAMGDVPKERGAMSFASGSHLLEQGSTYVDLFLQDVGDDFGADDALPLPGYLDGFDWDQVPLAAGDCTFHSGLIYHRAEANTTAQVREGMTIVYMAHDCVRDWPETNPTAGARHDFSTEGIARGGLLNHPTTPRLM